MRGLRTILFGIEPTDPLTLVSVGVSLMVVALLAVAVPACERCGSIRVRQ